VDDYQSKVTRRPRSKLERVVAKLEEARGQLARGDASGEIVLPPADVAPAPTDLPPGTVATTVDAFRLAARLGYPGESADAVSRALNAELPVGSTDLAWRARHLLDAHARATCLETSPRCDRCTLVDACAYRGVGADPALRLRARSGA
jgi:hypothetical protein